MEVPQEEKRSQPPAMHGKALSCERDLYCKDWEEKNWNKRDWDQMVTLFVFFAGRLGLIMSIGERLLFKRQIPWLGKSLMWDLGGSDASMPGTAATVNN